MKHEIRGNYTRSQQEITHVCQSEALEFADQTKSKCSQTKMRWGEVPVESDVSLLCNLPHFRSWRDPQLEVTDGTSCSRNLCCVSCLCFCLTNAPESSPKGFTRNARPEASPERKKAQIRETGADSDTAELLWNGRWVTKVKIFEKRELLTKIWIIRITSC